MGNFPRFLTLLAIGSLSLAGCQRSADSKANTNASDLMRVGAAVPDVSGVDQQGRTQHIGPGERAPLLVYFYPKDGTPGCTKEACAFRDVWQRFEQQKVRLIGVSRDDRNAHERFAREHKIPFPLIADVEGKWANAFGVPSTLGKYARISFLFDREGKLYRAYPNVDPGVHATEVLKDISMMPL